MKTSDGGEMRPPGGGVVTLRPVTAEDEEFLIALYESTRNEELSQVAWGEGQREAFVQMQFAAQHEEYSARFPDAEYDVILLDNRPAGRLWIGRADDQIRLLDIALLPEAQNKGVGAAVLGRLMEEAAGAGLPLRHMVFVLNTGAKRFYERLGFVTFEEVGAYLHMEWLPGTPPPQAQTK